ncbi:tetratricopeptide repeat protein [Terracidiphilus sp.]|jgi:tetratricopeptide (TPR) repeat protein|uniref:tetratricopeptide repeat protein n=1 Tax=Terracidiphilus sp. TaxID=1964191 RepID=UPI003C177165
MNQRHTHRAVFAFGFRASFIAAGLLLLAEGRGIAAQQQPAPAQQSPKPANNNDFPVDTNSVPVVPSNGINPAGNASNSAPGSSSGSASASFMPPPVLPGEDADPVRSPEDPVAEGPASTGDASSSSSLAGLARALDPPDEDTATADTDQGKRRRGRNAAPQPPEHKETAKEDVDVGNYYLSTKNWHAALSRFQSALILAPENPDVYWGLAEAQRNLKDYTSAKANYLKLLDYDPDNKHAKDARKSLKDPDVANAAPQK